MRIILYLIRKEFLQIFRNKFISKAIFAVPIVQMLVLVPAVTFEIRNINIGIVDLDQTSESHNLVNKLESSGFFHVAFSTFSQSEADAMLHKRECDMILNIPEGFGREAGTLGKAKLLASVDAINASAAQLSWAYLNGVIGGYNIELSSEQATNQPGQRPSLINVTNRFWYNEMLNYKFYMLPGILVILVTAVGFMLAGLNMVREKEIGTIEQINVTPVRKHQFVISKMVPFLLIGLADLALGLTIGKITFNIPFEGSILLMFLCAAVFLVAVLGLALLLSTASSTQQQYMFVSFFFMIVFILMSGIFTPFESMPLWAQRVDIVNPVAYLIRINRMVMLKGSTLGDIASDLTALFLIATAFTALAVRRYRKTA